jgi:hypothetical protein
MFSKRIIDRLTSSQKGIYDLRDEWMNEIQNIEDESVREVWVSIYHRLLYDTQWENWQLSQYKKILSLADHSASDICIVTGFPTMTALAYGYFDDPKFDIIYKNHHTPNTQMISWNTWGQTVINEDFRDIKFREYDLWINTIIADVAFVDSDTVKKYYFDPDSFDMDYTAFKNIPPGQECIWGWPYGGSRHTFPLMFEYPHPLWHNNDYLLNRWSKWFDIKDYGFFELSDQTVELANYEGIDDNHRLHHNIRHKKTDILVVKAVKK